LSLLKVTFSGKKSRQLAKVLAKIIPTPEGLKQSDLTTGKTLQHIDGGSGVNSPA